MIVIFTFSTAFFLDNFSIHFCAAFTDTKKHLFTIIHSVEDLYTKNVLTLILFNNVLDHSKTYRLRAVSSIDTNFSLDVYDGLKYESRSSNTKISYD